MSAVTIGDESLVPDDVYLTAIFANDKLQLMILFSHAYSPGEVHNYVLQIDQQAELRVVNLELIGGS